MPNSNTNYDAFNSFDDADKLWAQDPRYALPPETRKLLRKRQRRGPSKAIRRIQRAQVNAFEKSRQQEMEPEIKRRDNAFKNENAMRNEKGNGNINGNETIKAKRKRHINGDINGNINGNINVNETRKAKRKRHINGNINVNETRKAKRKGHINGNINGNETRRRTRRRT